MKVFLVYRMNTGNYHTNELIGWPYPDSKDILFDTRDAALERASKGSDLMIVELKVNDK